LRPGFLVAYGLAVCSLALGAVLWGNAGFDVVVVGLGWPHVLLGFLFYFQRVIRNQGSTRPVFFALLAVTAAICAIHTLIPITGLIYVFFMFHAFRDEIFIYRQHQSHFRAAGPIFDRAGTILLGVSAVVALASRYKFQSRVAGVEAAAIEVAVVCALAACAIFQFPRGIFQRFPGLRYALPAYFLILAVMIVLKVARLYQFPAPLFNSFMVVFHYFSWYVFYIEKIQNRPAPAASLAPLVPHSSIDRLLGAMSTTRGFLTVILLMNAVSFGLACATRVWGFASASGALSVLGSAFTLKYFLYVLVFHVTISFAPKGGSQKPAPPFAVTAAVPAQTA